MEAASSELLLEAIGLARQAGELQLACFRRGHLDTETKAGNDFDLVTKVDKGCEELVKNGIHRLHPRHAILSEESGMEETSSEWQWVIDPLDGTTNYNAGLPYFNISIGIRHKGETVVGVVYAACLDELFTAVKGEGARLNGDPIHCSACDRLSHAVICTGFPYDKAQTSDNNLDNFSQVMPVTRGIRRLGSAALDISYVAAGFLDGFWELALHEWDVCAATLIASEAGAKVSSLRPGRGCSMCIANPVLHEQLAAMVH